MKKIIYLLIATVCFSCSDKLSNSKAGNIIEDCLENHPSIITKKIIYGERIIYNKDKKEFEKLLELEKEGYLVIDSLGRKKVRYYGTYTNYNIQFTDKAKPYILNQEETEKSKKAELKICSYSLNKVIEVHEIPSLNVAEVRAEFEPKEISPFKGLYNADLAEFKIEKITFKKTSNGWKYCD